LRHISLGLIRSLLLLRPVMARSQEAAAPRRNPQHPAPALHHVGTSEKPDLAHAVITMAQALKNRLAALLPDLQDDHP
jgi:hypothetical protein